MASGDKTDDNKAKGFAALSTLVTNVDQAVFLAIKPADTRESEKAPTKAQVPKASPKPQEPPPSGNSFLPLLWLLGITIASVGGVYAYYNANSDVAGASSSQGSAYTSTTQEAPASTSTWQSAVVEPPVALRSFEEQPPVGGNLLLSIDQIRYCLAEEMRLEAAEPVLDNYNDAHVFEFNRYVDDYNSRCSEYRYYEESFAAARQDVVSFRDEIRSEGIARFSSEYQIEFETVDESAANVFGSTTLENEVELNQSVGLNAADLSELDQFLDEADSTLKAHDPASPEGEPSILSDQRPAPDIRPQNKIASAASPQSSERSKGSESIVRAPVPIRTAKPSFPSRALERGISGTCEVNFDLDSRGKPKNVVAVCSNSLFVSEAERAVSRYEYIPKMVNGRPVEQPNMVVPLEFVLE